MRMVCTFIIGLLIIAQGALGQAGVKLNGQFVPKDKFLVVMVVGNSNTRGVQPGDDKTHPRAWVLNGKSRQWELARDPLPRSYAGPFRLKEPGGVSMPLLKALVERFPDYHFGVVIDAYAGSLERHLKNSPRSNSYAKLWEVLEPYVGNVTFIGAFCEFNQNEQEWAPGEYEKLLDQYMTELRTDLKTPDLPFVFGQVLHNQFRQQYDLRQNLESLTLFNRIDALPDRFKNSAVISSIELPMLESRHLLFEGGNTEYARRGALKMAAMGWATPGLAKDTTPPTPPTGLKAVKTWDTGLTLTWEPSTDNLAVEFYDVYCDDQKVQWWPTLPKGTHHGTTGPEERRFSITGLKPASSHKVMVKARDYAGNESAASETLAIQTSAQPTPVPLPLHVNVGGKDVGEWLGDKPFFDGEDWGFVYSPGGRFVHTPDSVIISSAPKALPGVAPALAGYRMSANEYAARVPNGRYRITWHLRTTEDDVDVKDHYVFAYGGGNQVAYGKLLDSPLKGVAILQFVVDVTENMLRTRPGPNPDAYALTIERVDSAIEPSRLVSRKFGVAQPLTSPIDRSNPGATVATNPTPPTTQPLTATRFGNLGWIDDKSGLLFAWRNGQLLVKIPSPTDPDGTPCRVEPQGLAYFGRVWEMDLHGGAFRVSGAQHALVEAAKKAGKFAVRAVVTPAEASTEGCIATVTSENGRADWRLAQEKDALVLYLRTSANPADLKRVPLSEVQAGQSYDVVVSYSNEYRDGLNCLINGKQLVVRERIGGDLQAWTSSQILFGNDASGAHPWRGGIEGVAIFSRGLNHEDARQMSRAYKREPLPPLEPVVVEAKLAERSEPPNVKVYGRSLVIFVYDVQKVIQGKYEPQRVQVYHWAVLDHQNRTGIMGRKVGESYRLSLVPFEKYPALKTEQRSENAMSFDLPVFFDPN